MAEDSNHLDRGFGEDAQIGDFLLGLPPVTRTSWEVPDPDFSRSCSDMMLESAREQARALLTRLRIPERLWHLPSATFSGCEQQGVNIARNLSRLVLCCCSTSPPAHWMGPIRRP